MELSEIYKISSDYVFNRPMTEDELRSSVDYKEDQTSPLFIKQEMNNDSVEKRVKRNALAPLRIYFETSIDTPGKDIGGILRFYEGLQQQNAINEIGMRQKLALETLEKVMPYLKVFKLQQKQTQR